MTQSSPKWVSLDPWPKMARVSDIPPCPRENVSHVNSTLRVPTPERFFFTPERFRTHPNASERFLKAIFLPQLTLFETFWTLFLHSRTSEVSRTAKTHSGGLFSRPTRKSIFCGFGVKQLGSFRKFSTPKKSLNKRVSPHESAEKWRKIKENIWWFPEIGVPPVIIHILVGFFLRKTIQLFRIPHDYGKPHMKPSSTWRVSKVALKEAGIVSGFGSWSTPERPNSWDRGAVYECCSLWLFTGYHAIVCI